MCFDQIVTRQRRMLRLNRLLMRRRHNQQIRTRRLGRENPHRGVFEHQALSHLHAQPFRRETITARVGFAEADVFGGDHHVRFRDPCRCHSTQRQRPRR